MNTYQVLLTPEAEDDLCGIYRYIASVLQERSAAQRLVTNLRKTILDLETMPERWNRYDREPWFSRGIRKAVTGNYIIFYTVQDRTVFVLSVLYGHRDLDRILEQRI